MAMEDLSSVFCYQESVEELKQKLLYMTYELQSARKQADEEVRKNKESMETMKEVLLLLQFAYKERDEAREQLQKLLLSTLNSAANATEAPPILSPETTLLNSNQGRTSSAIAESNSLSDTTTYNNPHNSSPVDSLYDVVSPDSGNKGFAQHNAPFVQDFSGPVFSTARALPHTAALTADADRESVIIYNLAKRRPLPRKGKLLQAVLEAGPLLQTLIVAGPLPRWRNPPPVQPLQSPPVAVGGFDGNNQGGTGAGTGAHLLKWPLNSPASGFAKMPCGSTKVLTGSVLNFTARSDFGSSGFCLSNTTGLLSPANGGLSPANGGFGGQIIPTLKRQRIQ